MITLEYTYPASGDMDKQLYLDIETTGFSRSRSIIYMIGCGYISGQDLKIIQWFNDDGISEPDLLGAFYALLDQEDRTLVTFNGEGFDIPFLEAHFQMNDMACDLKDLSSQDYYRELRPFRKIFQLDQGRQKNWEQFLGIHREDRCTGGDLIGVYKNYLKYHREEDLHLLALHNREDILGLTRLQPLTAYPAFWKGDFSLEEIKADESGSFLQVFCHLNQPVPVPVTFDQKNPGDECPAWSCRLSGSDCVLSIPLVYGSLKHFYDNPGDYYYLPAEDRAIHKSVACYVDREYRVRAKASNCYGKKEGIFLPLPCPGKPYAPASKLYSPYEESSTLYRMEDPKGNAFLEFDDLFDSSSEQVHAYLTGLLNEVF